MVWADLIAAATIAAILYIPDPAAVAAQLFLGDYFHDWDVVFMGPVYGLFCGGVPNIDTNTTYGLGLSLMIKWGMRVLRGFDYDHVVTVLCLLGIVYYVAWYFLLRRIIVNPLLAFIALILGMRLQMFVSILIPVVWNDIQCSVLRFYFDMAFFWSLYWHQKTSKARYLWLMATSAALGMFHMPTMGIFLLTTFIIYLGIRALARHLTEGVRALPQALLEARALLFVPVMVMLLYYGVVGHHLFTALFWKNTAEFASFFAKGYFYSPMLDHFKRGEYLMSFGALMVPLWYLGAAFFYGWRYVSRKRRPRDIFIVLLCVYGLGTFTYFVGMSHKYSTVCLPAVFSALIVFDELFQRWPREWQFRVTWILLAFCIYSLATEPMFRAYPNLLNVSRDPIVDTRVNMKIPSGKQYFQQLAIDFPDWIKVPYNSLGEVDEGFKFEKDFVNDDALKSYYHLETAFLQDTALIEGLTPEGSRVALLSSFEVMILSKAHRKPFFYYFPLLNSHPMRMRNFIVTTIFSYSQLQRVIDQIALERPQYVFMEKVFLTERVHPWYFEEFEDLINVIRYVKSRYEPYAQGKYLIAMKRKPNV